MQGEYNDWIKAGKIAAKAMQYGLKLIKPGAKRLEVLDAIEAKIIDQGGFSAFPAQISYDKTAAHDCSDPDDPSIFQTQLIKLDLGVHINGAVADLARSVDLSGEWGNLVKASFNAQESVRKNMRCDMTLGEVGSLIQDAITKEGFSPIKNLCGHGLDLYVVHKKPSIPNFNTNDNTPLPKNEFIAIEPFATNGVGMIQETDIANLFSVKNKKPIRSLVSREVFKEIEKYNGLPFTTRWLVKKFPLYKVKFALKDLINLGVLQDYPPLNEKAKGMVSQCENSYYIGDDKVVCTTYFED